MNKENQLAALPIDHEEMVQGVRSKMMGEKTFLVLARLFKVFGDPTRVKILWALNLQELCVLDICNVLGMNKSAISHQLSFLREAKLVKGRKEGKEVYYSLDDEHVKDIFETGLAHITHLGLDREDKDGGSG